MYFNFVFIQCSMKDSNPLQNIRSVPFYPIKLTEQYRQLYFIKLTLCQLYNIKLTEQFVSHFDKFIQCIPYTNLRRVNLGNLIYFFCTGGRLRSYDLRFWRPIFYQLNYSCIKISFFFLLSNLQINKILIHLFLSFCFLYHYESNKFHIENFFLPVDVEFP